MRKTIAPSRPLVPVCGCRHRIGRRLGSLALPHSRAGEQGGGVSFRLQSGKPVGACRSCSLRAIFGNDVLAGMDVLEQSVGVGEMPCVEFGDGALLQFGDLRRIIAWPRQALPHGDDLPNPGNSASAKRSRGIVA